MKLNKSTLEYINSMIKSSESINSIKAFCKGYGLDTSKYSSAVHIGEDKISINYRGKASYVSFRDSKIKGTTYFI